LLGNEQEGNQAMSLSRRRFLQLSGAELMLQSTLLKAQKLSGLSPKGEEMTTEMVDLELAQRIVSHATEKATKEFGRPVCVSVCDRYGFLVAFARMDGAPMRSIEISRRKAFTAIWMGVPTDAFVARLHKDQVEARDFGDATLCGLPGGNLLKNASGNVLGAVGLSGLQPNEDQSIADAMSELMKTGKV
jgi:uncharacterized protein GlcG (DUF336 family)